MRFKEGYFHKLEYVGTVYSCNPVITHCNVMHGFATGPLQEGDIAQGEIELYWTGLCFLVGEKQATIIAGLSPYSLSGHGQIIILKNALADSKEAQVEPDQWHKLTIWLLEFFQGYCNLEKAMLTIHQSQISEESKYFSIPFSLTQEVSKEKWHQVMELKALELTAANMHKETIENMEVSAVPPSSSVH